MTPATPPTKTTKAARKVLTIEDIVTLESAPYGEMVPARNLHELFLATASLHPDRPALTVLKTGMADEPIKTLTHSEWLTEITRAANLFASIHAGGAGVTAILCPTLPLIPAAVLGAQLAGIASTINYLLNVDAIVDLLVAEGANVLVIPGREEDPALWEKANAVIERVPTLKRVMAIGGADDPAKRIFSYESALDRQRGDRLDFDLSSDRASVCALFHTGGTTGRPKLVRLTHGNQIHAAWAFAQVHGLDEFDAAINGFPLFHVGGTITVGLSVLAAGGHMIVPSPYALRRPEVVQNYWRLVERFRATIVSGVPTSIAALAEAPLGECQIGSVRMGLTGGAVLPKAVGERFQSRTGVRLFETYGMTETAAAIAFNPGRGNPVAGSVGFRAPYAETKIVKLESSDQGMTTCPPLASGAVLVRGPQVFPGYVNPEHDIGVLGADGWLVTGDIGYLTEDQRLVLTGREKDLIIRGGHNVDPASIEDVANSFPGVQISAAVGMPDAYAGEAPILFAVPEPKQTLDLDGLKAHLAQNVIEPPARPKRVVLLDALPVTAVGKIFKPALRDLAIRENALLEIEQIFGEGVDAKIEVEKNEKLETIVRIAVASGDQDRVRQLEATLSRLPQRYIVVPKRTEAMAGRKVLVEFDDGVAVITLNRPEALNALSHELMHALDQALDQVLAADGVRAVVITGAGRAFSAGGDLIEFGKAVEADPTVLIETLAFNQRVFAKLEALPFPAIAAVNGTAIAGGLELILCCDVVIAAEGARIGDGHAKYGVIPAAGATVRLMRKLPANVAMHLFFSAEARPAEDFLKWGLVNEVQPFEVLVERSRAVARQFCRQSPQALKAIKALALANASGLASEASKSEIAEFRHHVMRADFAEGLLAFREKRQPKYAALTLSQLSPQRQGSKATE